MQHQHTGLFFRDVIHGQNMNYAIFFDNEMTYFLPVLLDSERANIFYSLLQPNSFDYTSIGFSIPIYLFVFDLLRALSCSLDGIYTTIVNKENKPTLDAVVRMRQSNEIGTCVGTVSLSIHDAAVLAALAKKPILFEKDVLDRTAVSLEKVQPREPLAVLRYIHQQIQGFDNTLPESGILGL